MSPNQRTNHKAYKMFSNSLWNISFYIWPLMLTADCPKSFKNFCRKVLTNKGHNQCVREWEQDSKNDSNCVLLSTKHTADKDIMISLHLAPQMYHSSYKGFIILLWIQNFLERFCYFYHANYDSLYNLLIICNLFFILHFKTRSCVSSYSGFLL